MLGRTYRWTVYNGTTVSITFTVTTRLWKYGTDGALVYSTEQTYSIGSVANGSYGSSSTVDNSGSTELYEGAEITLVCVSGSSATGTCSLFLDQSTDGGTDWPDNGHGRPVGGITFAAETATKRRGLEV
jgi:hypothetical protein